MGDHDERPVEQLHLHDARSDVVDAVWHLPTGRRGSAPVTVVLAHGAGGNLHDQGLVALARVVVASGHRAVRVNLPYRQRRAKGPPPRAEASVADWAAVRGAVLQQVGGQVVIGGKSYGGRVATMLVARDRGGPDAPADARATIGVLCHSYPLHPPDQPERVRVDHFRDVTVPVLFLQGTNDPFGGPDELAGHLHLLGGGATVVAVAGGDHALHVPRTRSADGRTHRPPEVVAGLGDDVAAWLGSLRAADTAC